MSRSSNRSIERYYFEQFRSHYRIPDGELQYDDKPDVVIRGEKTVGIEIARLYRANGADPASEQVQRIRRLQVLDRAQALHSYAGGRSIELSADFSLDQPIHEIEPVAQALAELAKGVGFLPSGQLNPRLFEQIPQLRFVYYNATEYEDAKWRPVQSHGVPSLSIARLREVVDGKAEKAKAYQPCDAYWLLLVVDFMDSAQDQDIQWLASETLGKSPFERVLLYKPQFAQVVRVPQ
jgi:hypothetical protein